jgi:hypothetical protein
LGVVRFRATPLSQDDIRGWMAELAVVYLFLVGRAVYTGRLVRDSRLPPFAQNAKDGAPGFEEGLVDAELQIRRFARDDNKKRLRLRGIFEKTMVFVCYYNY